MGRDLTTRVESNASAQQSQPQSIGQLIQNLRPEIARALPRHMDADRMARIALTVVRRTPKLAQCTPQSFMGALLSAAQLGLELGVSDEAYLVPYEHRKGLQAGTIECQFIIGYQGYAKLFWQHPMAKNIDAQAVYTNDEFDYEYGLNPFLRHKPSMDGPQGDPIAYYAVASLTSGGSAFVVLSAEQVKRLRNGKVGPSGDIPDPMHWMERKTAVRQLVKLLPKSPNLQRALNADETVRTDLREDAIDAPVQDLILGSSVVDTPVGDVDTSTGEIVDPPVERPRGDITQAQQRKLHALLRAAVGTDRDAGIKLVNETLTDRPDIKSTDELSKVDAGRVIDELERLTETQNVVDPEVDQAWLAGGEPA